MANLTDTKNLTRSRLISISDRENYREVPSFGNGNCAEYTLISALIDLIKRNQLHLSQIQFDEFYQYVRDEQNLFLLKEQVKLFRGQVSQVEGNAYTDLADPLENIIAIIEENPHRSFEDFKHFINDATTRRDVAAIHFALAPAIRSLASAHHINAVLDIENEEEIEDGLALAKNARESGRELIEQVAKIFKFNVTIFNEEADSSIANVGSANDVIEDAPTVSVICISSDPQRKHFNYLLPSTQENGLACLPLAETLNRVNEIAASANKLFTDVINLFSYKQNTGPNKWENFVENVQQEELKLDEYFDFVADDDQIIKVTDIDLANKKLQDYAATSHPTDGKLPREDKTVKVTQVAQEKLDAELAKKLQQEEVDAELARRLQQEESDAGIARMLQEEENNSFRMRR